jgi:hypothetical protein
MVKLTNTGGAFKQTLIGYIIAQQMSMMSMMSQLNGNAFIDFIV